MKINSCFKKILLYVSVIVVIFLVFAPCLRADFFSVDDAEHFLKNSTVYELSTHSIQAIFSNLVNRTYIPLTTLSFTLEYYFFGFNPFIFHLDNLLLHIVNVLLVLLLARRMGLSLLGAILATIIFGIHPMKVESVAWVTERKDVLYSLFYLLALHQYISFIRTKSIGCYLGTFLFGMLSMFAKPMALSLPLILLLFDWFEGRKWDKNIFIEKIPFFIYTIEIASLSFLFNVRNPIFDIAQSILVWIWCFDFYIWKFLFPYRVCFVYSLPEPITLLSWPYILSVGMFLLIIWSLIRWRHNRFFIFAFVYYSFSIFFLLRFDNKVDFTIVSDRFMYLPCLGFCLALGFVLERWFKLRTLVVIIFFLICLLGWKTFKQCLIWKNSITLWNEVVNQYPEAPGVYYQRGYSYNILGNLKLALIDYNKTSELDPNLVGPYMSRAAVYASWNNYKEAFENINQAITLDSLNYKVYLLKANIEEKNRDFPSAIKSAQQAQKLSGFSLEGYIEKLQNQIK